MMTKKDLERGAGEEVTEASTAKGTENGAKVTIVSDLNSYEESLSRKSAQEFLVKQLGVSVHSIEIDVHPQGRAIHKYVADKTNHKTTPVIFIRGEFLGGFEDVNSLYSTGTLEKDYLKEISHADRCELMIADSKTAIQPLFWFPEKVNGHAIRATGILTCLSSAASAALCMHPTGAGAYIAYFILLDFFARILAGSTFSLLGRLGGMIASSCFDKAKPRAGRPKQFACCCGLLFSLMGSVFYLLGSFNLEFGQYIGAAFMGMLACASGMEGFLDFCLGCVFFRLGVQLGIFPK